MTRTSSICAAAATHSRLRVRQRQPVSPTSSRSRNKRLAPPNHRHRPHRQRLVAWARVARRLAVVAVVVVLPATRRRRNSSWLVLSTNRPPPLPKSRRGHVVRVVHAARKATHQRPSSLDHKRLAATTKVSERRGRDRLGPLRAAFFDRPTKCVASDLLRRTIDSKTSPAGRAGSARRSLSMDRTTLAPHGGGAAIAFSRARWRAEAPARSRRESGSARPRTGRCAPLLLSHSVAATTSRLSRVRSCSERRVSRCW